MVRPVTAAPSSSNPAAAQRAQSHTGQGISPAGGHDPIVQVASDLNESVAATEIDIADLIHIATPLTATGREYAIDPSIQQILCFLDNGALLVSRSHAFSPHIQGFEGRLRRMGVPYEKHLVDLSVISKAYELGNRESKNSELQSDMQMAARKLFSRAVEMHCSDIHIRVSNTNRTQILFRIHSDLAFIEEHPYEYGYRLCSTIYQAMSDVSDAIFEPMNRQDGRISNRKRIPEGIDGIRIATSPIVNGFIMILRLLFNDTTKDTNLVKLGYDQTQDRTIQIMKRQPTGINIIAGPTGSGKSTTLQRVLSGIIRESEGKSHIITVEDPPEYPIPGANQTPVTNADTEEERRQAFQNCIKAAMRCDPDIIMIGEIRDGASARLAIEAAMTGHQVWTTLHANNAFAIIDRLENLDIPIDLLTDNNIISGLVCQRLLKLLCPHCSSPLMNVMKVYEQEAIERIMSIAPIEEVKVMGPGCDHCKHSGIIGRTVVAETVATTYSIMRHLKARDRMAAIETWKREQGGLSMKDHAILKVSQGLVDPFQAEAVVGTFGELTLIKQDEV